MLLPLETEEGDHRPRNEIGFWKLGRQGNGFSPRASQKECGPAPADILILAQ